MKNLTKQELISMVQHIHAINFMFAGELAKKARSSSKIKKLFEEFMCLFALTAVPVLDDVKAVIPGADCLLDNLREIHSGSKYRFQNDSYMKPGLCECPHCLLLRGQGKA